MHLRIISKYNFYFIDTICNLYQNTTFILLTQSVIPMLKLYLTNDVNMNKQPVTIIYETLIDDGSQGPRLVFT